MVLYAGCLCGAGSKRGQHLPSIATGLSERGCIAHLPLDRPTHLSVQSLIGLVQTAQYQGGATVECMLFYNGLSAASTLLPVSVSPPKVCP